MNIHKICIDQITVLNCDYSQFEDNSWFKMRAVRGCICRLKYIFSRWLISSRAVKLVRGSLSTKMAKYEIKYKNFTVLKVRILQKKSIKVS